MGKARKFSAHGSQCQPAGITVISCAIETMGGMSSLAAETIANIGRLLGQRLGLSPYESTRHLFQRLSIPPWRGNAALRIHRSLAPALQLDGVVWLCPLFYFILI